jgi:hypothetical protein
MKAALARSDRSELPVVMFVLCLVLAFTACAQQVTNTVTSRDDANLQLLDRINQLEVKVKQLEERQAGSTLVPEATPMPEPPSAAETLNVNEVAPRLKLIVVGDVGAQGYAHAADTLLFGSLDLFMRARLSGKVFVLGEVLFIAQNDNTISPDVERLLLQYRRSDNFAVFIGHYHSWVGYYNTAFNYGEYLETTTDRPYIYSFAAQGGVLPMQDVGVCVTGKIFSEELG